MAGLIIWCITVFGCAILFVSMGIYAQRREEPMWFWAGSSVDKSTISDVKAYNMENGRMWIVYSLWYFASGAIYFFIPMISVAILFLACTLGIGILVATYNKIEKKYKIK